MTTRADAISWIPDADLRALRDVGSMWIDDRRTIVFSFMCSEAPGTEWIGSVEFDVVLSCPRPRPRFSAL